MLSQKELPRLMDQFKAFKMVTRKALTVIDSGKTGFAGLVGRQI